MNRRLFFTFTTDKKRHAGQQQKVCSLKTVFAGLVLAGVLTHGANLHAGPGHDHGHDHDSPASQSGDSPKRQANGEVFLPKPAQRQLSVRTLQVKSENLAKVVELNGRVVLDPQTGGLVQTILGGHFVPPESGLLQPGQSVKKGQILGYVHEHQSPLQQSSREAELAQLRSKLQLAEARLGRIKSLADTVPGKELIAAQADVMGLQRQIGALAEGIDAKETLRAPTAGVLAFSNAISGKVFAEGDVVFEVADPYVLRVEAQWFQPGLVPQFASASVQARQADTGGGIQTLGFVGASGSVKGQSLTLVFQSRSESPHQLAVGQLLKVYAQMAERTEGVAVPSSSVHKNASNQTVVWVKKSPEVFEPRVVLTEPLNGAEVLVRSGLQSGDKVVVEGSSLINQIR